MIVPLLIINRELQPNQIIWAVSSEKLKNGMDRPSCSWVIDENKQNIILINNSYSVWHTKI